MLGHIGNAALTSTAPNDDYRHAYATKPKFEIPDDTESEQTFLATMRKDFYDDVQYDRLNREAALEDTRFMVSDQWDDIVRQRRESARKPCLTINRLPAFIAQVVGQRRMNETSIKVQPDNGGTVQVARVREGLLRSIQKLCRAEIAFDKALENQVICGIGNFQVELDYESEEVFDQVIKITAINDALAVVWDRMLNDPTGSDARHCFVIDTMTKRDFYRLWPWAQASDVVTDVTLRGDLRMNGWIAIDDVRVVSYWRMRTRPRTLALMLDGSTLDVTDELQGDDEDVKNQTLAGIAQREDGTPIMREVQKRYAQMYLCSGLDILEGPYELPISRLPVFRVPGWEVNVGEWKHRWGIIRFLKDPQRLHNYWRSVVAEKIMQTPRAVWVAPDSAVAGRETQWRQSHLSDDPLLIWNADSGQKPERVPPAALEDSLLGESALTTQDMKDVSNIHEANLGMPSNEVSGAAIVARQRVSDFGTILYHDNLTKAIEECGRVCNDLIDVTYDTPRVIKVLGVDAKQDLQVINAMGNPNSIDIGIGKYSISVTTGASYATKRIEAAEHMMTLINAAPQIAPLILDLLVMAQDWPMAEEIGKRWRKTLPPGIIDQKDMTPDELAAAAQQQQSAAQKDDLALKTAVATWLKTQSEAQLNSARAQRFSTEAAAIPAKVQNESMSAASMAAEREAKIHLDAIRVADGK
jgi:hypothetical protein